MVNTPVYLRVDEERGHIYGRVNALTAELLAAMIERGN